MNKSLAEFYEKDEKQGRKVIQTLIEQEEVSTDLLTSRTVLAIVSSLNKSDSLENNKERVELCESLKDLASIATRHEFVVRLLSLLPEKPPNALEEKTQFVLSHLNELQNEDVPTSVVEHLHDTLITYMKATTNAGHKVEFLPPLIRHIHKFPSDLMSQFIEQNIKQRLSSGQPAIVFKMLEAFSISTYNILDHNEVFGILYERGKTNLVNARLISFLMEQSTKD